MTLQIDCLGKTSPVLRVSIHICGVSKEIHGETLILQVNLGMWPLKSIVSEKSPVLRVSVHIYRISKEMDGKSFIFQVKPRHVTPQIDHLGKMSPVLRVSIHIYEVSKEIDRKTFIFRVNLVM